MKLRLPRFSFSWIIVALILIAASLLVPAEFSRRSLKVEAVQQVQRARELYLAAVIMNDEGTAAGNQKLQTRNWRDAELKQGRSGDATSYLKELLKQNRLNSADLQRIMTAADWPKWNGQLESLDASKHLQFTIYAVHKDDPHNTLFLATKNFCYNIPLSPRFEKRETFRSNGFFIVLHTGGNALVYRPEHSQKLEIIGQLPSRQNLADRPYELPVDRLLE